MPPRLRAGTTLRVEIKEHSEASKRSIVVYSDCGAYRYALTRVWDETGGLVNFVMLNPSVADAVANDPTVERCERRARQWGFGAFCVTNIFAWRDTDPAKMRKAKRPVGPDNDTVLLEKAHRADQVVAAWGVHGAHLERGPEVRRLFHENGIETCHLGLTQHGHPRHPLYVPYSQSLVRWVSVTD